MENNIKHSLGRRAFFIFFGKRVKAVIVLFGLTGFMWYAERWLPVSYLDLAGRIVIIAAAVSGAYFIFALFQAWLEHHYYTYTFTEEAFLMTFGYMVRNEVAAPYHQIQSVSIRRTVRDRMVGLSEIVIFLAGAERETSNMKIVLPGVGARWARLVQKELLIRSRKMSGM